MLDENLTIALLIDGENLDTRYIEIITDELSALGRVTYKRLYGTLGNPKVDRWREISNEHSITISPQYTYTKGKNASDIDMAISAMDILYSNHVNAFCIMSNDSDFTGLAKRLKESNVFVIGAGLSNACPSFKNVCDRFFMLDELDKQRELEKKRIEKLEKEKKKLEKKQRSAKAKKDKKTESTSSAGADVRSVAVPDETIEQEDGAEVESTPAGATPKSEIYAFVRRLFTSSGKSVLDSGDITKKIYQRYPDFDYRIYGAKKSYQFFEGELFEVVKCENSNVNIKIKD
ncbi:MAG: NYN domain-containing protein [Clostridia bacterium]|nr:NYN domain-containing protein [Clostridia bacterium]